MTHRLFLYGTLCDAELFGIVAGTSLAGAHAILSDHGVVWAKDEAFPLIVERPGASAKGLLVEVGSEAKDRLDFYELAFGYNLGKVFAECDAEQLAAEVYFPEPDVWLEGPAWSLPEWQDVHGPLAREAAVEYMRLFGRLPSGEAASAFPQIRSRAASRLRAYQSPSPQDLVPALSAREVRVDQTRQPYTAYFAVREDVLKFPTFDGGQSGPVLRASFMGGDAVTVLPYDPVRDSVLMVRQFRHGPFARGDDTPWTVEPAAGRIDPGEAPEDTARRELFEETGLRAQALHRVAAYYPSPGAYSEFITSYVAIADLSRRDGTTAGLADEHEDIMSHVVAFDRLIEMIESGAANTGPLVLTALWLAGRRDSFRGAH